MVFAAGVIGFVIGLDVGFLAGVVWAAMARANREEDEEGMPMKQ